MIFGHDSTKNLLVIEYSNFAISHLNLSYHSASAVQLG